MITVVLDTTRETLTIAYFIFLFSELVVWVALWAFAAHSWTLAFRWVVQLQVRAAGGGRRVMYLLGMGPSCSPFHILSRIPSLSRQCHPHRASVPHYIIVYFKIHQLFRKKWFGSDLVSPSKRDLVILPDDGVEAAWC